MISILYYLGVMQFIVRNIGQALAFLLGTSPAESINAAGNIFVGMVSLNNDIILILETNVLVGLFSDFIVIEWFATSNISKYTRIKGIYKVIYIQLG